MTNFIFNLRRRFSLRRPILEAYLVALLLIMAVFPDVLFNGASLRVTDQLTGAITGGQLKPVYPIPNTSGWWAGYNDNGGATFQSDPMIEFMAHTLKNGESPYWNPYSAAGALGPEALVDQKFSALTLASALFGGSSISYNIAIMIAIYFGVFFIYRTVREVFGLSAMAAATAATFYLLNGYLTANLGSNVTQSYLYIPVCLYTALMLIERFNVFSWSMVVLAFALFFSCTFMPTTITGLIAVGIIIVGYLLNHIQNGRYSIKQGAFVLAMLGAGLVASILLLAPLYFPFLENLKSLGTLEDYSKRVFWALRFPNAMASFFSPSHFFESYNATEAAAASWDNLGSFTGNSVFHSGIVAIALASCAVAKIERPFKWLVYLCAISCIFVVVRLFDPFWVHWLFSYLPIVGNIGSQYWWPVIMIPMVILVGFGMSNLQARNFRTVPFALTITILFSALFYLYDVYGLREPFIKYKTNSLYFMAALVLLIGVVMLVFKRFPNAIKLANTLVAVVMLAMLCELMVWGKMIRFERSDIFQKVPAAVQFVKDNIGNYRTLNFAQGGLVPELGSAYQIQEVTTMNQGSLPAYNNFFYSAFNLANNQRPGFNDVLAPRGTFPSFILIQDKPTTNTINWNSVNLLGVKYLLLPTSYTVYITELLSKGFVNAYQGPSTTVLENKRVLPRAFSIRLGDLAGQEDVRLPDDFQSALVPASIDSYRNGEVVLSGNATEESLVVLSDNWHSNWSALLNGGSVPIIKVENTFRGVVVPPGHYTIKMTYQPKTLPLAIGASLLTILLLILLGARRGSVNRMLRRGLEVFR